MTQQPFGDAVHSHTGPKADSKAGARQQADTETPTPAEDPARIDRLRPEFTDHASVEAIDAQLRRARAQERRWHIRTEWLISLRADRVAQKERGEWPAAGARQDAPPVEPCPPGCIACATDESHDPAPTPGARQDGAHRG